MKEKDLFNYYVENDYLNLTNSITEEELIKLIELILKLKITLNYCTIPKDFKHIDIIKKYYSDFTYIIKKNIM